MGRKSLRNESDIRRRYRAAMSDDRYRFPRTSGLSHRLDWYFDGHLRARPLSAIYAYANLAEYMLHYVRFGRCRQEGAERTVSEFFAETRRAMQNVLSTYPMGKRLDAAGRESLAKVVDRLCEHAKLAKAELDSASDACECPACSGNRYLRGADVRLLEAILCEQSRNGTIPPTSPLYRASAVDKLPRTVV